MTYTNETEGVLREEVKKRRSASGAMNIGAPIIAEFDHPV